MPHKSGKTTKQISRGDTFIISNRSHFKGIVTGAGEKGTWVRIFQPTVEGKIIQGFEKLRIGDKVSVKLNLLIFQKVLLILPLSNKTTFLE